LEHVRAIAEEQIMLQRLEAAYVAIIERASNIECERSQSTASKIRCERAPTCISSCGSNSSTK